MAHTHAASVLGLPRAVLGHCMGYVGDDCYRFVAGTSRSFEDAYKLVDTKGSKRTRAECISRSVSCVRLFLKEATGEQKQEWLSEIAAEAAKSGRLEVVVHCMKVLSSLDPQWNNGRFLEDVSCTAARHRQMDVAVWAWREGCEQSNLICGAAAEGGDFELLKWAYEHYGFCEPGYVLENLVSRQDLEQIRWALGQGCRVEERSWYRALSVGNLEIIEMLYESPQFSSNRSDFFSNYAWAGAGSSNKVKVLQWLYDHAETDSERDLRAACSSAVNGGALDVLEWAKEMDPRLVWLDYKLCARAAMHGHLDVLQWLRDHQCPWDGNALYWAERNNHERVLEWARVHGCPRDFVGGERLDRWDF